MFRLCDIKKETNIMNKKLFAIGAATLAAFVSYPLIAADSPAIKAAM